jgi:hypothetical protein
VTKFISIVTNSTVGLKRVIGISSRSISDSTYFHINIRDYKLKVRNEDWSKEWLVTSPTDGSLSDQRVAVILALNLIPPGLDLHESLILPLRLQTLCDFSIFVLGRLRCFSKYSVISSINSGLFLWNRKWQGWGVIRRNVMVWHWGAQFSC